MSTTPAGTPRRAHIRAIPSTIATKSSPTIPAPSTSFEPHIKQALQRRLIKAVFVPSLASTWLASLFWTALHQSGLSLKRVLWNSVSPGVFVYAVLVWGVTAVPSVVLRKVYLSGHRVPTTSPAKTVRAAFSKPSTTRAWLTYTFSSITITLFHVLCAYMTESNDPKLTLFVKSRKHPLYLNGRLLFILLSQLVVAAVFSFRTILMDRFTVSRPSHPGPRPSDIILTTLTVLILTTLSIPLSMAIFAFIRVTLPIGYSLPILPRLLKPFTYHFLRGSYTLSLPFTHIPLITRAWCLGAFTVFAWEYSDLLFSYVIPEPVPLPLNDPTSIISGLSSTDTLFARFAFYSLADLAERSAPARALIFSDQRHQPSLWSSLLRSCLVVLGEDYQRILRRGAPPPPKPAPAVQPQKADVTIGEPTKIIKAPIFKGTEETPIEKVVDVVIEDKAANQLAHEVPELFRSTFINKAITTLPQALPTVVPPTPSPAQALVSASISEVDKVKKMVRAKVLDALPRPARMALGVIEGWWERERQSRVVDAVIPRREVDALAIRAIAHLTCASLEEDRFGVVQRDLGKILETLISLLIAIETYQAEVVDKMQGTGVEDNERVKAEEMMNELVDALKEALGMIIRTFGEKLAAVKVPLRTAARLESFVDYA